MLENSPNRSKKGDVTSNNDDINLEDVPAGITPATILIEVIKSMEDLRQTAIKVTKQEDEYDNVLRALKSNQQINTCSMTLELMVQKLKASQE